MHFTSIRCVIPLLCLAPAVFSCGGHMDTDHQTSPADDAAAEATLLDAAPDSPASDVSSLDAPSTDVLTADAPPADSPTSDSQEADATGADVDSSAGESGVGCPTCLMQAQSVCAPAQDACAAKTIDPATYASYRKDFYYPQYQEGDLLNPIPAPVSGGRFNITGVAQAGGKVKNVKIGGQLVTDLLAGQKLDWYHVYPLSFTPGEAFWVDFHSRQSSWDQAASETLEIETEGGIGFSGTFPVNVNRAPLKYVTFADDYKTLLIHVEPRGVASAELSKILYDGRDVTASACVPETNLQGGVAHLITVPLCTPAKPGDPWTVTLLFDGLPPSTAGGRVMRDFFPIETWQKEGQCPYPMYNTALFDDHVAHGFDTFFTRPTTPTGSCGGYGQSTTLFDLVGTEAVNHDYHTMVTFEADNHFLPYPDVSRIAAAFHADECDDALLDNGYPKPQSRADYARRTWETWPDLPTYIGGSRHRYNGAFAGATDIQGFDFYVAACAPHITVAGTHPPLRGAFDMLLAVHENHMPHTSWFYTQGLHDGWNAKLGGTEVPRQPTAAEYRVQALSVLMAGGKGIMYFQTDQTLHAKFPATWEEIGAVNRDVHGLRPFLREADVYQIIQQDKSYVASVLRSRRLMALVVFDAKTSKEPTELQCVTGQDVHWGFADNAPTLELDVPPDFQVAEIAELRNGQFLPVDHQIAGRHLVFPSLALSQSNVGRIIVLMADPAVKADMLSRMTY